MEELLKELRESLELALAAENVTEISGVGIWHMMEKSRGVS
jgi:hypothetical protein